MRAIAIISGLGAVFALVACSDGRDEAAIEEGVAVSTPAAVAPTPIATNAPVPTATATVTSASTASAPQPTPTEPTPESAAAPVPTVVPNAGPSASAAARQSPSPVNLRCDPGLSFEAQRVRLIEILAAQFPGETSEGLPRLQFGPDARALRQGGIWAVLEFNGEELETTALKKAALDRQMRDAYEALYTAGCDDLAQVDLSGIQKAPAKVGMMGQTVQKSVVVYKTRLKRSVADTIDWAEKESLDFTKIWDNLLLNPRWREELKEIKEGS